MKNKIFTIVITGSASSGKSSILKALAMKLRSEGVPVITFQETATELLESGFNVNINKKLFQSSLFDFQLSKERIYREYMASSAIGKSVFLIDRGLLDGAIYINDEAFSDIIFKYGFTAESILARYDAIIQLQPSAFVTDYNKSVNNESRMEDSAEECFIQDKKLQKLYLSHRNYHYVKSEKSLETKLENVLSIIKNIIEGYDIV